MGWFWLILGLAVVAVLAVVGWLLYDSMTED